MTDRPSTAVAVRGLVEALWEIGACSPTVAWRDCCDTCLRRLVDCDGSVSSDRCPGKKARAALATWRSRVPLEEDAAFTNTLRINGGQAAPVVAAGIDAHLFGFPTQEVAPFDDGEKCAGCEEYESVCGGSCLPAPTGMKPGQRRDWLAAVTKAAEVLERAQRGWPEGDVSNAAYHALKDMDRAIFGDAPNHHRVSLLARLVGLEHKNLWPADAGPWPGPVEPTREPTTGGDKEGPGDE